MITCQYKIGDCDNCHRSTAVFVFSPITLAVCERCFADMNRVAVIASGLNSEERLDRGYHIDTVMVCVESGDDE